MISNSVSVCVYVCVCVCVCGSDDFWATPTMLCCLSGIYQWTKINTVWYSNDQH